MLTLAVECQKCQRPFIVERNYQTWCNPCIQEQKNQIDAGLIKARRARIQLIRDFKAWAYIEVPCEIVSIDEEKHTVVVKTEHGEKTLCATDLKFHIPAFG